MHSNVILQLSYRKCVDKLVDYVVLPKPAVLVTHIKLAGFLIPVIVQSTLSAPTDEDGTEIAPQELGLIPKQRIVDTSTTLSVSLLSIRILLDHVILFSKRALVPMEMINVLPI
ncbi:unnamed protein product [Meganyctiphanes norvegica]|uniref:Uncharacterized protein n=1 Tax=Meganyctiphanes norvegica TaxID=48144 RepID=A0AAV2SNN6_MEGNR